MYGLDFGVEIVIHLLEVLFFGGCGFVEFVFGGVLRMEGFFGGKIVLIEIVRFGGCFLP